MRQPGHKSGQKKGGVNMTTKIKLTGEAYIQGGALRVGACELREWYEAAATDNEGNQYRVIWTAADAEAYNWEMPWAILDEYGNDVSDRVDLV